MSTTPESPTQTVKKEKKKKKIKKEHIEEEITPEVQSTSDDVVQEKVRHLLHLKVLNVNVQCMNSD